MHFVDGKLQRHVPANEQRHQPLIRVAQGVLILMALILLAFGLHAFYGLAATGGLQAALGSAAHTKASAPASASLTSAVLLPLASVASFIAFAVVSLPRQASE
jgi:hypothetical protein